MSTPTCVGPSYGFLTCDPKAELIPIVCAVGTYSETIHTCVDHREYVVKRLRAQGYVFEEPFTEAEHIMKGRKERAKGRHDAPPAPPQHRWKETGEGSIACDPPTMREQCEVCGAKCWHYHGVQGYRFRKGRDRAEAEGRAPTRDEMRMEAIVEEDEGCPCPNPNYGTPRPIEPPAPDGPNTVKALPRKLNMNWSPEAIEDFRKLTDEDPR